MAHLVEEWKAAVLARQQKKTEACEMDKWSLPGRGGKFYQEDYENYSGKRVNLLAAQRFPPGYPPCPPNDSLNIHLHNSFRINPSPYVDPSRMQPRIPIVGNYHPYQPPSDSYSNCDGGHPLSTKEPLNPLRSNYSQVLLRPSSLNSQLQHYPENQRLNPESIRQFSDFSRTYQDQRQYQISRTIPTVNVLHEHRLYGSDVNSRTHQMYPDNSRQTEDVQRMMVELPRQYLDAQRPDNMRPSFGSVDSQRMYPERLLEKQRQYSDGARQLEGPRAAASFQKPPLLTQRSIPETPRVYRELENDEGCFQRSERFSESPQDGTTRRVYNPGHFKGGRSLSVEVHYLAGPPAPREMIPLQGAPGPPQGSPRPLVARGLQTNMHRLPANSVVHFRKPQGAFT